MSGIPLGTSAFTTAGWEGTFYPEGMKPAVFSSYYATKFNTVEMDSTIYRTPPVTTVSGSRSIVARKNELDALTATR